MATLTRIAGGILAWLLMVALSDFAASVFAGTGFSFLATAILGLFFSPLLFVAVKDSTDGQPR